MRRYFYSYQGCTAFSMPVGDHIALLRCQPQTTTCQRIVEEHLVVPPHFWRKDSSDCWGNRAIYLGCRSWHRSMMYASVGIVEQDEYAIIDPWPGPLYELPTSLTKIEDSEHECEGLTAEAVCHYVHDRMAYRSGATTNKTTAQEAWQQGEGVCQDFAHVMIALCRQNNINARYVVGLIEGEGETHAWVEVWEDGVWTAFDPTHDRKIDFGYIKIAHGRDAADCQVCRGMYKGTTTEENIVRVLVHEL